MDCHKKGIKIKFKLSEFFREFPVNRSVQKRLKIVNGQIERDVVGSCTALLLCTQKAVVLIIDIITVLITDNQAL